MPIPPPSTPPSPTPGAPKPVQAAADKPLATSPAKPVPNVPENFDPIALILACILPGLGHWYLGEKKRAVLIASGVLGLFFGGMLIGGIDVVDRQEDPIWFIGEALVGPLAFGVDYVHQNHFKVRVKDPVGPGTILRSALPGEIRKPDGTPGPAGPGQNPPNTKSLGRMNELGTLFATIAGMLNLIVVIDAAVHRKK